MKRGYSREKYLSIIHKLKTAIPDIGITTDIITGYIGESEQDYEDTLSLVKEVQFDSAFMFSYSPRENTPAFKEHELLSPEEKSLRLQQLIDLQTGITLEKIQGMVGKSVEILLEGPSRQRKTEWVGKTSCFKKVVVPFQPHMAPGMLVLVDIKERRGITLAGTPR
jgi:tRNA-2-methylthio-N6-dimethylallyladenosine synthase